MKITSTKSNGNTRFTCLIYGQAGIGKTTLASTIKGKCLLISAEAGTLSLADYDIDMIDISRDEDGNIIPKEERINEIKKIYKYLQTPEAMAAYRWIFIDSITEISQNMVEALQKEFPDRKETIVLYGENSKRMRALIKGFRDLPHYNIVFTALSEDDKDSHGKRTKEIAMVGKISQQIAGYLDEVFFMHSYEDEDGNITRRLLTQPTDKVNAKDRSGKLERFEEPNLDLIYNKINNIGDKHV